MDHADSNYDMNYENDNNTTNHSNQDHQDYEATQTQSTQQASQEPAPVDAHLWGYLQPCNTSLWKIDFWRIHPKYTIGRNTEQNQVVLPGPKISNTHCEITWDGIESETSVVVVKDLSSNGTFINGVKIGKNSSRIIREGNEIAFGTAIAQEDGRQDYRFIYRHTAGGPPTQGLYAKYDVGHELGKGSFATVRRAMSREDGKWYAVKMIRDTKSLRQGGAGGETSRNVALTREISIMEQLKHDNICRLFEVFYQEDTHDLNLVLELVEGGDLLEYILKEEGLSEPQGQHITYQMCDAIAYVHSKGVTHRDLKPENILLTRDNPPIVKVADFGLAKVVDSLTMLRTMCGTPSYLAPEVVTQENFEGYDNLVDSWSIGVIVFSMLTNAGPFMENEAIKDMRTRIATRKIDWNTLAAVKVSKHAENFIRSMLQYFPKERMSVEDTLNHPWLLAYKANRDRLNVKAERGMANVKGQKAPLKRRADVLARAVEDGVALPEPSWQMIDYANSQEQQRREDYEAGPSNGGRGGKRGRELSPAIEESMEEDVGNDGSSSGDSGNGGSGRRSSRRKVPRRH